MLYDFLRGYMFYDCFYYLFFYMKGHKIDATIGGELITKFQQSVKEGGVYIMYNFYVTLNQLELKTTSHEYFLNFTSDTKIKAVENELVPIYSYVFTHPTEFLSRNYRSEVLVGKFP
jgi:hypothetical protein